MATPIEQMLRNLPVEAGVHCSRTGVPWAVVRRDDHRVTVYVWALDEPFPNDSHIRATFPLTPRQAAVAVMLLNRRTNAEIAVHLGISVNTAKRHVEAVLLRLGVRSRNEVEGRILSRLNRRE
jgi:DNA-binding CsgD family transcriptional regulator